MNQTEVFEPLNVNQIHQPSYKNLVEATLSNHQIRANPSNPRHLRSIPPPKHRRCDIMVANTPNPPSKAS